MSAQRSALDADRWHWCHGPIEIVAEAHGDADVVASAHDDAWRRFEAVLIELVEELPMLRQPVGERCDLKGPIARRMWRACAPFHTSYITPMAAVAGSVAQELIGFYQRPGIERAWLNNGGDIALHLAPGQSVRVGMFSDISRFDLRDAGRVDVDGSFDISSDMPVRGVATSGWRGRSFSLGIADSVTVLAATAAQADAAATVIANAVDVQDAGIQRRPASECKDDSDLGDIPVTIGVDTLAPDQLQHALEAGMVRARALQQAGLVFSAVLVCQNEYRVAEPLCSIPAASGRAPAMAVGSVFA